jgi:hypothetical protein
MLDELEIVVDLEAEVGAGVDEVIFHRALSGR